MIAFYNLSASVRALFALWALLLCLTNIGSTVLAAVKKRYRFTIFGLLLFAPVYLLWQVIFDISLFGATEKAARISLKLCGLPTVLWLIVFSVFTALSVIILMLNIIYDKKYITPGTIKLYLDKMPCGICCWRDNGRVLFSNICMNELCVAVTGGPLLNGSHFRDAITNDVLTVDGKVWRFSCRDIFLDGEKLKEMIASDITTEYVKAQMLEKDKAELSQLNRSLREYYLNIDDTVRRQEILQAKVNIHDEMNRLMLSTVAASGKDTAELDHIFSLWEKNALLLCMEAEETDDKKASGSLEQLAEAMKIRLIWKSELLSALSEKQRGLFFSAAKEAIINALKHADAKTVSISFTETKAYILCGFTNDGKPPVGPVKFTGGLLNLSVLADKQGASVSVSTDKEFTLSIFFPKNTEKQAIQPTCSSPLADTTKGDWYKYNFKHQKELAKNGI